MTLIEILVLLLIASVIIASIAAIGIVICTNLLYRNNQIGKYRRQLINDIHDSKLSFADKNKAYLCFEKHSYDKDLYSMKSLAKIDKDWRKEIGLK